MNKQQKQTFVFDVMDGRISTECLQEIFTGRVLINARDFIVFHRFMDMMLRANTV